LIAVVFAYFAAEEPIDEQDVKKIIGDSTSVPCWGCRQDQRLGPQSLASGQIVDACGFGWVCGRFLATLMRLRTCFVGLSPCGSGERSTGRKVK